jgi:hypothetical protein
MGASCWLAPIFALLPCPNDYWQTHPFASLIVYLFYRNLLQKGFKQYFHQRLKESHDSPPFSSEKNVAELIR